MSILWPIFCLCSIAANVFLFIGFSRGRFPDWFYLALNKAVPAVRTKDKMHAIMEEGERKGCIASSERKLVENVFRLKERSAEDVMIHRRNMVMLSETESRDDILYQIVKTGLSRFPVYAQSMDDIVGILTTRQYLLSCVCSPERQLGELVYPAYFVPKTVGAERLLRDMQSRNTHMAIVVDEYGGVDGLVTLEDLLEEIVGNIYDEFDPMAQDEIVAISENLWRVSGTAHIEEVAEAVGLSLPEVDFETVSGLIYDELDMIPENGRFPKIEAYGMTLQVEHIVDRRIIWVTISLVTEQAEV